MRVKTSPKRFRAVLFTQGTTPAQGCSSAANAMIGGQQAEAHKQWCQCNHMLWCFPALTAQIAWPACHPRRQPCVPQGGASCQRAHNLLKPLGTVPFATSLPSTLLTVQHYLDIGIALLWQGVVWGLGQPQTSASAVFQMSTVHTIATLIWRLSPE